MKVTYRVRGDNAQQIHERAHAQAEAFFGNDEAMLKIDVAPLVTSYGTDAPLIWEAEVEARDE